MMEIINLRVVNSSLSHFISILTLEDPNPLKGVTFSCC